MFWQQPKNYIPNPKNKDGSRKKVFVGVSGGVDSSVSLALLKKKGFDVTGVFIKVYHPEELGCAWRDERADAISVCQKLDVPFLDCDLEKEYKNEVFDYMIETYKKGDTPNPDVFCNKYVKFGGFLKFAMQHGADYVATGHYARNVLNTETGLYEMHKGNDDNKDQTYFLYTMPQETLAKVLFPIGAYPKKKVRTLAKKFNLFTSEKKDSQGLCFVGPVKMKDFLQGYIDQKPGDVLDADGTVVGSHDGAFFFTLGERHGFTVFSKHKTPNTPRLYVIDKDIENNTIIVGPKEQLKVAQTASSHDVVIRDVNWITREPQEGVEYQGRIRYRGTLVPCVLQQNGSTWNVHFETPQTAIAKGQSVVIYSKDQCIGGGIIA